MVTTNSTENVVETTTAATDGQATPTPADAATQQAASATPTTGNAAETKAATDDQPTKAADKAAKQKADDAELIRLTKVIKGELSKLTGSLRKTTETAYQIGLNLKAVRKLVKAAKKSWEDWVNANLSIEIRQVQKYVRLADRWEKLKAGGHDPASMTIEQCLAVLAKPSGPIPGVKEDKSTEVAAVKPTANGFSLSGTSELTDKKLLANELQESEQFFAAESEEKKFVADKLAALVRQIRQVAQKIGKGKEGPQGDVAVLAIALSNKIVSELKTLPVLEIAEATAEQTPVADPTRTPTHHNRLNGYAPVSV